ncbi:hypothetical protein ABE65_011325 [Fictibacillus phosphorivorans]|uniref:DUF624 domain-containing protein n=1 Tax=Fictibacillus phosphorivorans TaxID=1221500 RepID=A0A160INC1_9BACL|nr:DUF624 domain-containing protein [Fictibacillus phosphorivorans]ANC77360.1 hypothetical protein ABE65_011325 [Fictibacillus phosphorivorans]
MKRLLISITSMLHFIGNLVILNGLWLIFTTLGMIAFGLFPSTAALFAVIRKSFRSKSESGLLKDYWFFYKKEFMRSNVFGCVFLLFAYFFYIDWKLVQSLSSPYSLIGYVLLLGLLLVSSMVIIYLFSLLAHYEIPLARGIKTSILLGILYPFSTLMMLFAGGVLYYVFSTLPILIPFFGVSVYAYILSKSAISVFNRNENKLEAA